MILKGLENLENKRTSGDHPNYYITENSQNTEMSQEDLRSFAVTQTPVKDHPLMLLRKNCQGVK